ncbi:MAG: hypothetical protein IJQ39_09615 [Thermoguttaceae bacterium]|nr:hypothetical protein [Thermoguttaceae bacterium]
MKKILAAMIAVGLCLALCSSVMAQGPHHGGPGFHGPAPHGGYHPGPAPYRPLPPPVQRYYRPLPPPPPAPLPPPVAVPLAPPAPLYAPGYYYPRTGIYYNNPNFGISIAL